LTQLIQELKDEVMKGRGMKHLLSFLVFAVLLLPTVTRAAYDPTVGTWLSRDPIGEGGGINLYQYVGNNPIWAIDPLGLDAHITVGGVTTTASTGQQLLDQLNNAADGSVNDLRVEGHATNTQQGIGTSGNRDVLDDINGTIELGINNGKGQIGSHVDILDLLRKKLSPNATIELNGCHTAAGGNNITNDLAHNLPGHPITGSPWPRTPWFNDTSFTSPTWPVQEAAGIITLEPGTKTNR